MARLNLMFTEQPVVPPDDEELLYTDRRSHYTNVALGRAGDGAHPDWDPALGWAANRARIVDLYAYYAELYRRSGGAFLWAGLAHMAGSAIVSGLDSDPGFTDQIAFVQMGKEIFYDLARMHEAYLDAPDTILQVAALHDRFNVLPRFENGGLVYDVHAPSASYAVAWKQIASGNAQQQAEGNTALLHNEQFSIVQPHYDVLNLMLFGTLPNGFTRAIHPYHHDFIIEIPGGQVLQAADRWRWITGRMLQN